MEANKAWDINALPGVSPLERSAKEMDEAQGDLQPRRESDELIAAYIETPDLRALLNLKVDELDEALRAKLAKGGLDILGVLASTDRETLSGILGSADAVTTIESNLSDYGLRLGMNIDLLLCGSSPPSDASCGDKLARRIVEVLGNEEAEQAGDTKPPPRRS